MPKLYHLFFSLFLSLSFQVFAQVSLPLSIDAITSASVWIPVEKPTFDDSDKLRDDIYKSLIEKGLDEFTLETIEELIPKGDSCAWIKSKTASTQKFSSDDDKGIITLEDVVLDQVIEGSVTRYFLARDDEKQGLFMAREIFGDEGAVIGYNLDIFLCVKRIIVESVKADPDLTLEETQERNFKQILANTYLEFDFSYILPETSTWNGTLKNPDSVKTSIFLVEQDDLTSDYINGSIRLKHSYYTGKYLFPFYYFQEELANSLDTFRIFIKVNRWAKTNPRMNPSKDFYFKFEELKN